MDYALLTRRFEMDAPFSTSNVCKEIRSWLAIHNLLDFRISHAYRGAQKPLFHSRVLRSRGSHQIVRLNDTAYSSRVTIEQIPSIDAHA